MSPIQLIKPTINQLFSDKKDIKYDLKIIATTSLLLLILQVTIDRLPGIKFVDNSYLVNSQNIYQTVTYSITGILLFLIYIKILLKLPILNIIFFSIFIPVLFAISPYLGIVCLVVFFVSQSKYFVESTSKKRIIIVSIFLTFLQILLYLISLNLEINLQAVTYLVLNIPLLFVGNFIITLVLYKYKFIYGFLFMLCIFGLQVVSMLI